jgi:hypothetical protein
MNFNSYARKAINLISAKFIFGRNFIYPNLHLFNLSKAELPQVKKILFYFANPKYMHLGDHLFFLPLLKLFSDSGYQITVMPTKAMLPICLKLGLTTLQSTPDFANYDLIIGRVEMLDQLYSYKALLVNVSKNLTMPICDQLITTFTSLFHLASDYHPWDWNLFNNYNVLDKFGLNTKGKLILFNLYCDSSSFLITERKRATVLEQVQQYAQNKDYQLVFVGSKEDKDKDKKQYNFSFIDLRGETSVTEIFELAASPKVLYYIGFDAFIMHVFSLFHKKSFVVFRGRLFKAQNDMLQKYHVNLFKSDNYVELLPLRNVNS